MCCVFQFGGLTIEETLILRSLAKFSKRLDGVRGWMAFSGTTHADVGYDTETNSAADLPGAYGAHGTARFQMRPHS